MAGKARGTHDRLRRRRRPGLVAARRGATRRGTSPRSGSTRRARPGFPKGAVHLQHDMVVCTDTYARAGARDDRGRPHGVGGQALLRLRARQQPVLPHARGRRRACSIRIARLPEAMFELIHRHRPTLFFGIPTLYAPMLQVKEAEKRYDLSSLRLCVSAGEALPEELYSRWRERFGVEIARRHRHHGDPAHLPLESAGAGPARARRACRCPATRPSSSTTTGARWPAGRDRQPAGQGRLDMAYYWNQHEKTQAGAVRALDPDRRQVLPGRRRLLLVLRPRRRHAEGRRHLGVAGRSRGRR